MTDWTELTAPDLDAFEAMAREVLVELPAEFAGHAQEIHLLVEEFADDETLDELQIDNPLELTGLYDGIPLTEKLASDPQQFPDTVRLYRRAILDEWASRGNVSLGELVRNVVIHELAHHFGWSDDDIARVDRWWE